MADRYDLLIPNEIPDTNGGKRTIWTRIGAGFPNGDGKGFNIEIVPGIAVSGRVVLRLHDPKERD